MNTNIGASIALPVAAGACGIAESRTSGDGDAALSFAELLSSQNLPGVIAASAIVGLPVGAEHLSAVGPADDAEPAPQMACIDVVITAWLANAQPQPAAAAATSAAASLAPRIDERRTAEGVRAVANDPTEAVIAGDDTSARAGALTPAAAAAAAPAQRSVPGPRLALAPETPASTAPPAPAMLLAAMRETKHETARDSEPRAARTVPPLGVAISSLATWLAPADSVLPRAPHVADSNAPLLLHLCAPVHSREFAPTLALTLGQLAREGVQEARLVLHPAEMGPIDVRIALDGVHAHVEFRADVAATRSAIEAGLPELAGALREAGLTLAGGGVFQQRRRDAESPRASPGDADAEQESRSDLPAPPARRVALGRVDLYA